MIRYDIIGKEYQVQTTLAWYHVIPDTYHQTVTRRASTREDSAIKMQGTYLRGEGGQEVQYNM